VNGIFSLVLAKIEQRKLLDSVNCLVTETTGFCHQATVGEGVSDSDDFIGAVVTEKFGVRSSQ
jgi:hypothetical protein